MAGVSCTGAWTVTLRVLPWVLACFLGGLLLGLWNGDRAVFRRYEEQLREHRMRESVLDAALTAVAKNKYKKRDALWSAVQVWNRENQAR